ncbi:MAG: DUF2959 domain-containing protein [Leptolyngbya sp. PLA1]|nr:DUF2959 domain-containing protein [Leptolyngbya sp. PLA1]
MRVQSVVFVAMCVLVLAGVAGCGAAKNATINLKESFGYAKRDQLVDAVKDTRDEQQAAKKQFASALDEFMAVTGAKGGELETRYKKLSDQYDRAESRANAVKDEISHTERVAKLVFEEWRAELAQYSSPDLRRQSERLLDDTQGRYDRLISVMKSAASKMDPVLAAFRDQKLFLKHNLTARAIASLQDNADRMQTDIAGLIKEMERAIAESNEFIDAMQKEGA